MNQKIRRLASVKRITQWLREQVKEKVTFLSLLCFFPDVFFSIVHFQLSLLSSLTHTLPNFIHIFICSCCFFMFFIVHRALLFTIPGRFLQPTMSISRSLSSSFFNHILMRLSRSRLYFLYSILVVANALIVHPLPLSCCISPSSFLTILAQSCFPYVPILALN